ncbi:MAG: OmpH family outer membrane protein [Paracoccaceae bacterium]|nr:OmpH family outer membrane protein [Paracoccaceae bacterium]
MRPLNFIAACIWGVMLTWAIPAQAQFSLGSEISGGVFTVDQEIVFQRTLFGKRLVESFQNEVFLLNSENERVSVELKEEEEALTVQRGILDQAEFRALALAFDQKVVAIRDKQREKERELANISDLNRQFFQTETRAVILKVLKENQVGVLVDTRAVIWSAPETDLTDQIISRIDADLGVGPDR